MPPPILILCLVFLALALFIISTLSLRGTLTVEYDGELKVYFRAIFIKIRIFPFPEKRKKHRVRSMSAAKARRIRRAAELRQQKRLQKEKEKRLKKREAKKEKKEKKADESEKKKLSGDQITDIIELLKLITELIAVIVKRSAKRLRVKTARLRVKVASPDAAVTAIAYGAVTQIVNILLPILSEVKNFTLPSQKNFLITSDFTTDTPEFDLKISFSLRVWHLLDIPFAALKRGIPEIPKYMDKFSKAQTQASVGEKEKEQENNSAKQEKSQGFLDIIKK